MSGSVNRRGGAYVLTLKVFMGQNIEWRSRFSTGILGTSKISNGVHLFWNVRVGEYARGPKNVDTDLLRHGIVSTFRVPAFEHKEGVTHEGGSRRVDIRVGLRLKLLEDLEVEKNGAGDRSDWILMRKFIGYYNEIDYMNAMNVIKHCRDLEQDEAHEMRDIQQRLLIRRLPPIVEPTQEDITKYKYVEV
ncbi:hypothetical protein BT96DRAFT_946790 [Gymnopus androsaceus JB14]|uniref:Uncharacterized protein n=1 Tax=Gymnopus androsaceus JB14 TaxID=1447944 RepID=A0A6A4GUK3_9AGAR|nr:hypothetical protein BT96DRAFT_946790 [Gymnopus androsaceus JB14]